MLGLLNNHSHYSLLRGFVKPKEAAKIAKDYGYDFITITDYSSLACVVDWFEACEKNKITAVIGTKIFIKDDDGYLTLIAKNFDGWKELVKLSSKSHIEEEPLLSFDDVKDCKNIIVLSGEPDSTLANASLKTKLAYTLDNAQPSYLDDTGKTVDLINKYKAAFKDRFFVAISRMGVKSCSVDGIIADKLAAEAKVASVTVCAVPPVYYNVKSNSIDHKLLLCSYNKCRFSDIQTIVKEDNANISRFTSNNPTSYIPTLDELYSSHKEDEIKGISEVFNKISNFSVLSNPILPHFQYEDYSPDDGLKQLCRIGWMKLKHKFDKSRLKEYVDRVNNELTTFSEAGLSTYFLVVQDYVNWAKSKGILVGPGRGCFLPDTRVRLPNGLYAPIASLKVNDKVIDSSGQEQVINNTFTYEIDEDIIELELENNKIIRCTKDHKFLTNRGWVEAEKLTEDDDIIEV